jgi:hypothetical protein
LPTEAGLPTDRFAAEKLVLEEFFRALDGESGAIGVETSGIWPRCTLMTSLLPLSRTVGKG